MTVVDNVERAANEAMQLENALSLNPSKQSVNQWLNFHSS
jgi:hypothetical protein